MKKSYQLLLTLVCLHVFTPLFAASDITIIDQNNFIETLNFNPAGSTAPLILLSATWESLSLDRSGFNSNGVISSITKETEAVSIENPLFYPSPFSIGDSVQIGFSLNVAAEIELRVYDMRGNEVIRHDYGLVQFGYPKLNFDVSVYGNKSYPAGVYYYVILSDGKALGNGKFALLP